ncbi:hypothetical protein SCRM01_225 [Synechococcus phage S-CRM01]|uniref:hypothetical protein n=1 Tax=Synechococcus phage S-CRM01 TaxID=1026955 RepID=UPI000209E432|nr:hypothetical protein SCRM01_225 [Synechococcus phage S-CRM01]AEC53171.1 hypothetical protein SCRM01_225 [Synechococcus phage S-CRM01]
MSDFRISHGPDVEWADDLDEARDIAFDWSVEEHGARITIEDLRTGKLTQVWA